MSRSLLNRKSLMMRVGLGLAILYWWLTPAMGQVACFNYGSIVSCDGPRGNTMIAPLSPSQGIISGSREGQSYLEPYTVIPSTPRHDSFSSHPIEPLNRLDRLDDLNSAHDRLSDPLSDPFFAPLVLGE